MAVLKPSFDGLPQARRHLARHAELARQADLADQHRAGADREILPRGGDGRGDGQVGCRLLDLDPADHVHKEILFSQLQPGAAREHGGDEQQAIEVHAVRRAAGIAELRRRGEPLDFDQDRAGCPP